MDSRRALGIGGFKTETSGTQQTVLGAKAAPPAKKRYKWAIILLILGSLALGLTGLGNKTIGALLIACGGILCYLAFAFNKSTWPGLYKYWQQSWLCHKCGNVFQSEQFN
jgi:hypothetical protein